MSRQNKTLPSLRAKLPTRTKASISDEYRSINLSAAVFINESADTAIKFSTSALHPP